MKHTFVFDDETGLINFGKIEDDEPEREVHIDRVYIEIPCDCDDSPHYQVITEWL